MGKWRLSRQQDNSPMPNKSQVKTTSMTKHRLSYNAGLLKYFFSQQTAIVYRLCTARQAVTKPRAVRLLGLSGEEAKATKKILTRFYKIRSTLVHGSPVSEEDLAYLQDRERWQEFEKLVRDLLRAALLKIPAHDVARIVCLSNLYN